MQHIVAASLKVATSAATFVICVLFCTITAFAGSTQIQQADGVGEKLMATFQGTRYAISGTSDDMEQAQGAFVTYTGDMMIAWFDSLGQVIPIMSGLMIVIGIILALLTSFSKRARGFGIGISTFSFLVFLLWLAMPAVANMGDTKLGPAGTASYVIDYVDVDELGNSIYSLEDMDTRAVTNIPASSIPQGAQPGDVLVYKDGAFTVDQAATDQRSAEIQQLFNELSSPPKPEDPDFIGPVQPGQGD